MKPTYDELVDVLDKLWSAATLCDPKIATQWHTKMTTDEEWDRVLAIADNALKEALTNPCPRCKKPTHVSEMVPVSEEENLAVEQQCLECLDKAHVIKVNRFGTVLQ